MTEIDDRNRREDQGGTPNPQDMQIDEETGLPVRIVPDGEKQPMSDKLDQAEGLRIDPDSRIPRPVQPDLA